MSRLLVLPLLALLVNLPSYAETADREKPMNVSAEKAEYFQGGSISIYTGNVVFTQGTMVMRADKVTMRQDAAGKQYAKGEGRPVRFKQKLDSGEMLDAEALRFDYDEAKGEMVLVDKAWVKKGQDIVMGDTIIYNLNTEYYQAQSKPGSRVNITINPKKKDAAK